MTRRRSINDVSTSFRLVLDERRSWRGLVSTSIALVLATAAATLVTDTVMELQAGATAFISGEGHWSRARQTIVSSLYRYTLQGDPVALAKAREALRVPLGDRAARFALERSSPDLDIAMHGLREGRNAEDDIPRLVWLLRYFSSMPYFNESIAIWRSAEPSILRLEQIADELEGHWADPDSDPVVAVVNERYRIELDAIAETLEPLEREFSAKLREGAQRLREILVVTSALFFLLIAGLTVRVYYATLGRIRDAEARFRAGFQQASVGMAKLRSDGRIVAANEELVGLCGYDENVLRRMKFDELLIEAAPDDMPLRAGFAGPVERGLRRRDGTVFWARLTVSTVNAPGSTEPMVFLIVEDISEERRLRETLAYQATHDGLTDLINRREIERRLEALLAEVHLHGACHTLCFVDLDQFKLVNDTCSHAAGDHLLRLVAATLSRHLRPQDWVGRLGGDEFAVLFATSTVEEARPLAESLNRVLAETSLLWEGRHFALTSSIGLVEMNARSPSVAWLLRAADTACYLAKDAGRNRVRIYAESDEEITRRHGEMVWANHTRTAIAEGRLRLYAQRIVPLCEPSQGLQYEVLVRLIDPFGNLCQPRMFLSAAERYSQAVAVDSCVITMTLDTLARHPKHLAELELCHVNVSGHSAASLEFRTLVGRLLDTSPVPPYKLCFELTETASIDRLSEACAFIDTVRERGCRVALDDFGSGLSSFAYLKSLPVDILKIDGIFVRDMLDDPLDLAVVRAVVSVARSLGKRTIAEWVESEEVLQRLRELGIDAAQGFAIHQPCPIEELLTAASEAPRAAADRSLPVTMPASDSLQDTSAP